MKKFWKSFMATLLIVISMTCTVFAKVDVKVNVSGNDVIINGRSNHTGQNVMIQTWSGDKKYYIDADKTDKEGSFQFKFKTADNMDYDGKINVGGELQDFKFSTKHIKLNKSNIELKVGESEKLIATITSESNTNKKLIWKSSDKNIATVDTEGEVKAIKEGKTTIEVTTEDGAKKDTCIVNVVKSSGGSSGGGGGTPSKPDGNEVKVFIRVEGYDRTVVPRTEVKVKLFNLNSYLGKATGSSAEPSKGWNVDKFDRPTHAHAIVKLLNDKHIKYDFQDYGWSIYMAEIAGDREFDHRPTSGWMYSVNGKLPPVGSNGLPVRDGDEVVWFFGAYGFDTIVTTLESNKTKVKAGEEIEVQLDGFSTVGANGEGQVDDYGQIKEPVNEATILVNGQEYKLDGKVVKTDSNGKAKLKFDKDGIYKISAIRYKKDQGKKIDIVRPQPLEIKVGEGKSSGGGGSSAAVKEEQKQEALKELEERLKKVSIKDNELNVKKEEEKTIVSAGEYVLYSAIKEAEGIIREINERYKDIELGEDVNIIPIDTSKITGENIAFRLEDNSIKALNDKGFGVKIVFDNIEVKVPNKIISQERSGKELEIRKSNVSKDVENKIVNSLNDKVLLPSYSVSLYEVGSSEKKISMKGTEILVKVDGKYFKDIRKNGTKIKLYDSENGKWILLKSKFDAKTNRVIGQVK
ncbi:DUF4430 domain-containing protein [Clostridium tetani]|uniref:DUF4430 domain-containing protein n=1 Tax=Clostridium tetani TaxID=1513 RepID=UPI00068D96FE|nr:DUF4430 domain-containing protein [Clostridium tetani]RXM72911.1 DUF4430 domain-containing protein [Clostridium tetani]SUY65794.1 surface/cell-adhesion protein [Clostridium tetani]